MESGSKLNRVEGSQRLPIDQSGRQIAHGSGDLLDTDDQEGLRQELQSATRIVCGKVSGPFTPAESGVNFDIRQRRQDKVLWR